MADTDKAGTPTDGEAQTQPGSVIIPTGAPREAEKRTAILPTPDSATLAQVPPPKPQEPPAPPEPVAASAPPQPSPIPAAPPSVAPVAAQDTSATIVDDDSVTWTAPEFVAHDKSPGWYMSLLLSAVVIAVMVFLLTGDLISTSVVIVGAVALAIYGARQPKLLTYRASTTGLSVGQRYHAYDEFRSFAIAKEGNLSSVIFTPLKRFAPFTTLYCKPEDEDNIVDLFIDLLPQEEHSYDAVDRFMQRIRF